MVAYIVFTRERTRNQAELDTYSEKVRASMPEASFSIAWNKSCGRCHRSEGRLYPSSSG